MKSRQLWDISNPRGHGDWFLEKANRVVESLLEKADRQVVLASAPIEKIPNPNFRRKKPLQRATQLLKRYRDVFFAKDDTYATSSIILTTIAGQYYNGEASIFDAMDGIIGRIVQDSYKFQNIYNGRIKVLNPVNINEDFTSKWDTEPKYYSEFLRFCRHLQSEWQVFKQQQGVVTESRILKGLFGDDAFQGGTSLRLQEIERLRSNNVLRQDRSTGILTTSIAGSSIINPNTFFGE